MFDSLAAIAPGDIFFTGLLKPETLVGAAAGLVTLLVGNGNLVEEIAFADAHEIAVRPRWPLDML